MATKFKGRGLALFIGGELVTADATSVLLDREDVDDDDVTFAGMASGSAVQWFMELNALSAYGAGSLWSLLWDQVGVDLAYRIAPYGNTIPTAAQPHFIGFVTVASRPPVGGTSGETWSYEMRLDCVEEPLRLTSATVVPYPSTLLYPSEILYPQGATA